MLDITPPLAHAAAWETATLEATTNSDVIGAAQAVAYALRDEGFSSAVVHVDVISRRRFAATRCEELRIQVTVAGGDLCDVLATGECWMTVEAGWDYRLDGIDITAGVDATPGLFAVAPKPGVVFDHSPAVLILPPDAASKWGFETLLDRMGRNGVIEMVRGIGHWEGLLPGSAWDTAWASGGEPEAGAQTSVIATWFGDHDLQVPQQVKAGLRLVRALLELGLASSTAAVDEADEIYA